MEGTRFVGVSAAARILGVSAESVRIYFARGILPGERTEGGVRLFERVAVEKLARERAARRGRDDAGVPRDTASAGGDR